MIEVVADDSAVNRIEMYNGLVEGVLRCRECNKPFDKESTLKRHGYYCRSQRAGARTTRRHRSCLSCAHGKKRCDTRQPKCSRCIAKGFTCQYAQQIASIASDIARPDRIGTDSHQEDAGNGDGGALVMPHASPDFTAIDYSTSFSNDTEVNVDDFWIPRTIEDNAQFPSFDFLATGHHYPTSSLDHPSPPGIDVPASIPVSPSQAVRSLVQRPAFRRGTQRIVKLMLHTLKSYPRMMQRQNTVPPFIHSKWLSSDIEGTDSEPMTDCANLMHMISSGNPGSRKLFWRNVQWACQRLSQEDTMMNKWELLSAMQALSIYLLVRLDEGERDHNNVDGQLVAAVIVIAQRLSNTTTESDIPSLLCLGDVETRWKDWIFEESKRRVCVIYQAVNLLVYFEPAAMCDHEMNLVLAPLPTAKQLWEAEDALAWDAASEKGPELHDLFGLAANGDLVRLDEPFARNTGRCVVLTRESPNGGSPSQSTADWEEWCSGMDGFGGLVMLAASLIEA